MHTQTNMKFNIKLASLYENTNTHTQLNGSYRAKLGFVFLL